jgi:ParB family chromosome partitioning protein
VKRVSEQQAAEMTLVENLQRQDLNCMEQAQAYSNLSTKFHLTQDEIGKRAGVSREQVSNYMRLLNLPVSVIGALQTGKLTFSHARTLLHLKNHEEIWKFAKMAMEENMSVSKLEDLVLGVSTSFGREPSKRGGARWVDPNVKAAQRSLEEVLGMRVRIRDRKGRGRILIEYATIDDFDRVVGMLKGGQ